MKIENVSLYGSIPVNDNGSSENKINFKMNAKEITLNNTIQNKLNNELFNQEIFNNQNITLEDLTEIQDSEIIEWPYESNKIPNANVESNNAKRRNSTISNLFSGRHRNDSIIAFFKKNRSDTITTIKKNYYKVIRYKHFKKFASIITVCFFIWLFFTLAFLPRTSLARDFRRLHHSTTYTKQEIYRTFLASFENSEKEFKTLNDKFSQSNNLIGDEILTQLTYDFLKQDLGYQVSVDQSELNNIVYNFDISLYLQDAQGNSEEISIYEPLDNKKINQLSSYILGDNLKNNQISYDITGQYIDVDIATRSQFEKLEGSQKNKIHLIKRNENMSIDSQILNSMSYGGIGCLIYNEPGASYDFKHVNETITRDYLLSDKMINIPVIPISYSTAQHLISNMSNKTLHMKRTTKEEIANSKKNKLYFTNIQFTIPGIWKDHEIIIGCQRDTFTYNGYNSGNMIFLQLAKTFSELLQKGWKPIRTIRFVSFDGNTLNNMAIKEHYMKSLKSYQNSLLFVDINKDSIQGSSNFTCRTTGMFEQTILDSIKHLSLYEGDDEEDFEMSDDNFILDTTFKIQNMKTKSSLAHFLFYENNIPTISCNFEDDKFHYPLNSNYMNKNFMDEFIETDDYQLHKLLAKFYGLLILNMNENEIVQYNIGNYIKDLYNKFLDINKNGEYTNIKYWKEIEALMEDLTIIFESFDLYNQRLLKLAYTDYPWYKGLKKIKILFKIRASNNRMIKIKNLFLSKIANIFEEDTRYLKYQEVDDESMNLFYQVNDLEGGEIEFLGKFKQYVQMNDRQGLIKYLRSFYKDLQSIKQYVLDEYPV